MLLHLFLTLTKMKIFYILDNKTKKKNSKNKSIFVFFLIKMSPFHTLAHQMFFAVLGFF